MKKRDLIRFAQELTLDAIRAIALVRQLHSSYCPPARLVQHVRGYAWQWPRRYSDNIITPPRGVHS
jgi:hypothetical protein